jgi:three-Cys-motif partner protein
LRYYLGATSHKGGGFMKATQRAGGTYYIDLFAGPGQVLMEGDEILDGSPLIAARATPPFSGLFWVDAEPLNAASLRAHRADFPERSIEVLEGDANLLIDAILSVVPKTQPTLAFLDPEGSELDWATIQKIARHKRSGLPKIEQFVLVHIDTGINRFFPHDPSKLAHAEILDRMLPDPAAWRSLYERRNALNTGEWRRSLLGLYVNGLRSLGYRHVPEPRLVRRPDNRPLYFMVFATDHSAGEAIMTAALNAVEATPRQTTFLPYQDRY